MRIKSRKADGRRGVEFRERVAGLAGHADRLIDSLPIVPAKWPRCAAARVAPGAADQGYCSTKRGYYHGVKLHAVALRRPQESPLPALLHLSRASHHDLTALRELSPDLGRGYLFGDKAYADVGMARTLAGRGTRLVAPYKRRRNEPAATPALWPRFASAVRQPLESLFGRLIQRTGIQHASQARSAKGLFVHVYGRLAVACLLLTFNSGFASIIIG